MPSLRAHHTRHFRVQDHDVGEVAPWPPEIGLHVRFPGDLAVREDKPIRVVIVSRSCGDVTTAKTMDVTTLKKCGGGTKYEIHMTGDVAILEILPAAI